MLLTMATRWISLFESLSGWNSREDEAEESAAAVMMMDGERDGVGAGGGSGWGDGWWCTREDELASFFKQERASNKLGQQGATSALRFRAREAGPPPAQGDRREGHVALAPRPQSASGRQFERPVIRHRDRPSSAQSVREAGEKSMEANGKVILSLTGEKKILAEWK